MRRLLMLVMILVSLSLLSEAQTTSTISGTFRDLSNALVTSGKVMFTLKPSADATISGVSRFIPGAPITCRIQANGTLLASDNVTTCQLKMNTALTPAGTYYQVDECPYNACTAKFNMYAVLASIDISSVTPTPATAPLYNIVDTFSDQTIGGAKTFTGPINFAGTLNGTIPVDGHKYACSDVGFNAAIFDGGVGSVIDTRGCTGTVTLAAPVRINKVGMTFILSAGATYTNTTGLPSGQGMFSPEADGVTLLGNNATLLISGVGRNGVRSLNSCQNVIVRDLVVTGSGVISDAQEGIEFADSNQGWTWKHIQLLHNTISNTIIGVDLINTDPVSTTEDVLVEGNKIFNIVGVLSGSGYGLVSNNMNSNTNIQRPMALKIIGNHFENSGRHEVYTSMTSGVMVVGNTFLRHRSSVFTNADLAAVPIARVTNYTLADNVFDTCYDGCIDVETDNAVPPGGQIARNISITGNVFRNSQWYDIIIGTSAAAATDGFPDGVTISGNAFYKDSSQVPTLAFFIYLQAGKNISIASNSFYMKGIAGDLIDIEGSQDSAGTATATDRVAFRNNILYADTAGSTPFRMGAGVSTSTIRLDFINNYVSIPSGNVFVFMAGQTDPNIHIFNTPSSGLNMALAAPLDGSSNWNVADAGGITRNFLQFTGGNDVQFRPLADATGFGFQTQAGTDVLRVNSTGTGTCGITPLYKFHCEGSTAGDIIAKFKNTSGTGFGVVFVPGTNANYAIEVRTANEGANAIRFTGQGVSSDDNGYKHQRFGATTATAASAGSTTTNTFSWPTAFTDANYTVSCIGVNPTGTPVLSLNAVPIAASITVKTTAITAVASNFAAVDCIATHDP